MKTWLVVQQSLRIPLSQFHSSWGQATSEVPRGNEGNCSRAQKNLEYSFCRALAFFTFERNFDYLRYTFLRLRIPTISSPFPNPGFSSLFCKGKSTVRGSILFRSCLPPSLVCIRKRGVDFYFRFLLPLLPCTCTYISHTSIRGDRPSKDVHLSASLPPSIGDQGHLVTEALAILLILLY